MKLRTIPHNRYSTKGSDGQANGFLVPIYNVHEGFVPGERSPKQVYLTVCSAGTRKGPHLHMKRWGYFTCVRGNARVVAKIGDEYTVAYTGEDHGFATIEVPAGVPNLLENVGDVDAYIINTPSPAWHVDDQDDHAVTEWNPPPELLLK
jgi:mannose-6-phosphate isomerase-like protein (cupin superfamily)